MDPSQKTGKPYAQARDSVEGTVVLQLEGCPGLHPEGRLPVFLGVCQPDLGKQVPQPLDHSGVALTPSTDETSGVDVSRPSAPNLELVPSQRPDLEWNRRGLQYKGEIDREKIVWFSDL